MAQVHLTLEDDILKDLIACARVMCPCADGVACPTFAGYTCQ